MTITPQELLEKTEGFYKTTDIYIASSLMASGVPLDSLIKNGKQYIFCFWPFINESGGQEYNFETLIAQYWNGVLTVSAKKLWDSYREIKNRMYSEHNEQKMYSKIDKGGING